MPPILWFAAITSACLVAAGARAADAPMTVFLATPQELVITRSAADAVGVSQVQGESIQVLYGDPSKAQLYTVLRRIAPHTRISPLSHPDARFATVLAGTWRVGFGDRFDEAQLKTLPAGGIYTEPGGANHFGMTGDDTLIIAITGYGPSGTTYVDPADVPSRTR